MIRKTLLAAILAASFSSIATPVNADIVVRVAPPPHRTEVTPAPRPGHLWVGGHWDWRNERHHWVKGSWVRERPGYHYNQAAWAQRDGRWHLARGGWSRGDRDGDGVPNRLDRAPDNPNRR